MIIQVTKRGGKRTGAGRKRIRATKPNDVKQRLSHAERKIKADQSRFTAENHGDADALSVVSSLRRQVSREGKTIEYAQDQIAAATKIKDNDTRLKWEGVRNVAGRTQATLIPILISTEERLVKLEKHRGKLISVDATKEMITRVMSAHLIYLRNLPEHARNSSEKDLLVSLAEGGLQLLSDTAQELAAEGRAELERILKNRGHTA
jgi:alanyl-tRNA synthetase